VSTSVDKIDLGPGDAVPVEIAPADGRAQAVKARGYWELVWSRFRRDRLAVLSVGFIFFLLFSSFVLAPIFAHILGHGPNDIFANGVDQQSLAPVGPWTHISTAPYPGASGHFTTTLLPLGADGSLGRDLFLRLLYGAQTSLEVALLATAWSVGLGVIMGLMAGYFRGWVDTVVSRLIEIVMVFPFLLFIIAIRVVAGNTLNQITFGFLAPGVSTLALIFAVFGWFYPARIIRGVVLSLREKEFVEAARALGATTPRVVVRHILPNSLGPVIVAGTIDVAAAIIAESTLSFLGLGFPPDIPTWGRLLFDAKDYLDIAPHWALFAGGAIFLTVLAINFIGDGLRDVLDPRKVT
jgi:peptide/nickel transport system permease protein